MSNICPICGRTLIGALHVQFHHLIPKTFKGSDGINIHKICHQKIHATFCERELLNYYHTTERIIEHPEMQKFINWVKNKHIDFYDKNDDTKYRHNKRRR